MSEQAINLTNASTTTKRRELDFYPTPPEVTHSLMRFMELDSDTAIWEPACGEGDMSEVLKGYSDLVSSSDLRHTGYGEGGIDFIETTRSFDAIITNPPFILSEEFIRHALSQAPIVAILLKSQYWHAKKRVDLFNEHPPAYVLPLTWRPDFYFKERANGKKGSPTMECHWTVWIRGDTDTKYRLLTKS